MRILVWSIVAALVTVPAVARAQELRNDGFVSGGQAGFQAGFVAGEIGAATLVAPAVGMRLTAVRLLFGGATSTQTVTVHVWDDTAAANAPGAMLFEGDFQLTGSNSAMQEVDLSTMTLIVPQRFRVGIELQHAGLPSIARDDDGSITAGNNFIYADLGASLVWFRSQSLGLTGDWIIRAVVAPATPIDAGIDAMAIDAASPVDGGPVDATSADAAPGDAAPGDAASPDAGAIDAAPSDAPPGDAASPDAGAGACTGNPDCAVGSYCDPATQACTFDCRIDDDCGAGRCNTLGQCVASEPEASGCCASGDRGAGGALGALGLAAAVGLLGGRRRRRGAGQRSEKIASDRAARS